MTRCLSVLVSLLMLTGNLPAFAGMQAPAVAAEEARNTSYNAASFAMELHRIAAILLKRPGQSEITALRDSLPSHWTISTEEGKYSISSEPLRDQLAPSSLDKAAAWTIHLEEEVESSTKLSAGSPHARADLGRILARPEFGAVRPPSPWELFRQRLMAWLGRLVEAIFGGIARHPLGGEILFWVLVVVGVGITAAWVFRFFASRDRRQNLPTTDSVVAVRTWQEWIRSAREAANAGNYREAVHCAYWAGIVRLEDAGVVPKDRTKTPREYLRLVSEPAPGQLATLPKHREQLTALTGKLELVWYANRGAKAEDFNESLRQLEALGCLLE
jgi:Domain of unknown function (DUF4129)